MSQAVAVSVIPSMIEGPGFCLREDWGQKAGPFSSLKQKFSKIGPVGRKCALAGTALASLGLLFAGRAEAASALVGAAGVLATLSGAEDNGSPSPLAS